MDKRFVELKAEFFGNQVINDVSRMEIDV